MATRLDVGNVSSDADARALRERFERYGTVLDVRVVLGGHVFVTMENRKDAHMAILRLNGATFDSRKLTVIEAREQPANAGGVRLVRTIRERTSVRYEIDHAGVALVLRMYPTDDGNGEATWKIEAELGEGPTNGGSIAAVGATRAAALDAVSRAWGQGRAAGRLPQLDWKVITSLLRAARAL
jgi:hypothetical protein